MTNKEIFLAFIERIKGKDNLEYKAYSNEENYPEIPRSDIFDTIFDHDYAKAFWGEDILDDSYNEEYEILAWQYHLQQMVLRENPLKYIEKFL